jgi:tripartite-type tricarboxylate transporter receptor subunit TctC
MARAAEWPDRPIRMILPFGPGSSADVLGRLLAEPLSQRLGQLIVCENHTGTAGSIAAEAVARMAPDGYARLLATIGTQAINRHLHGRLPYDPERDFTPLSHPWNSVNVMAVSTDSPWTDVQALIAAGRGRLTFGLPGNGTSDDMASSLFGIPRAAARPGLGAGGLPPEGLVTFTMQEAERYGALVRRLGIRAD